MVSQFVEFHRKADNEYEIIDRACLAMVALLQLQTIMITKSADVHPTYVSCSFLILVYDMKLLVK